MHTNLLLVPSITGDATPLGTRKDAEKELNELSNVWPLRRRGKRDRNQIVSEN